MKNTSHLTNLTSFLQKLCFYFKYVLKLQQGGNHTMKKIKNLICKISPAIISCFTLALIISANSSTCFVMHQPKVPAKLDDFKKTK